MEYICGVTFAPFACAGAFFKPGAKESLAMMKERTGANFVIFVPGGLQETPQSEEICFTSKATMEDDELIAMIEYAKEIGLRVALKPTVNCKNGTWRAHINFFELGVVLPISFYERDVNNLYNSIACIDGDGTILGVYRKTHIPDDHYYQEKFYFTPGDTGFKVFDTKYGCIGIGICWDQWFPETARAMALLGAELLFYPTAIGSEPILECDSMPHWRRCMQGHAAANLMPVIAANRIGREVVQPCAENGGQESALEFYGSSFLTDETGEVILSASRDKEEILSQTYELDELRAKRLEWGLFRDRRPEYYGIIAGEKNGR